MEQMLTGDRVGVADEALFGAVRNPVEVVRQADGSVMCVGENARVVLNENRKVITA